jgi:hypothetical protein
MRKSDLEKNHDAAIMRYRKFMEKVIDAQSVVVSAQEKRIIAESILIRLCVITGDSRNNRGQLPIISLNPFLFNF